MRKLRFQVLLDANMLNLLRAHQASSGISIGHQIREAVANQLDTLPTPKRAARRISKRRTSKSKGHAHHGSHRNRNRS